MLNLILKTIASILAAGYGVYATLTDFHEKSDGIDKLTKAGKRGIAFLLLVSSFGIATDVWKERDAQRKEREGQKSSAETAAELKDVLQTATATTAQLDTVLTEARRAADPLEHEWRVSFGFHVEGDQGAVRPYLDRVAKSIARSHEYGLEFRELSGAFPSIKKKSEASLADLADFNHILIEFHKEKPRNPSSPSQYSLNPNCEGHKKLRATEHKGINLVQHRSVDIQCEVDITGWPTKEFQSYRDMDGSNVFVSVYTKHPKEDEQTRNVDLSDINLEAPKGEELKDFDFQPTAGLLSKKKRVCELADILRVDCGSPPPVKIIACYSAKVKCN